MRYDVSKTKKCPGDNSEKSPIDAVFYGTLPFQSDLSEFVECRPMLIEVILNRRS